MKLPHIYEVVINQPSHTRFNLGTGWINLAPAAADQLRIAIGDEVLIKFGEEQGQPCASLHVFRGNQHQKSAHFGRSALSVAHPDATKEFLPVG